MKRRNIIKPTKIDKPDGSYTIYYSDGSSIDYAKPPPKFVMLDFSKENKVKDK